MEGGLECKQQQSACLEFAEKECLSRLCDVGDEPAPSLFSLYLPLSLQTPNATYAFVLSLRRGEMYNVSVTLLLNTKLYIRTEDGRGGPVWEAVT